MDRNRVRIGISSIGWTNDDMPELGGENTFEQCVSEMALAGYAGCEVGNKFPKDPAVLRRFLVPRGLSVCNAWFSTRFAEGAADETVEGFIRHRDFLSNMGARVVGCSEQSYSIQGLGAPIFGDKPVFSDAQWRLVFDGYARLADLAEQKGMRVCMHHHMGTGVQTPDEIARFMDGAGERIGLLFDTGHIYFSEGCRSADGCRSTEDCRSAESGQAAVDALVDAYAGRIAHVHLKDVRRGALDAVKANKLSFLEAVRLGAFTTPGDGAVSFGHVFAALDGAGYSGWLVVEAEQDPAKANPFEYALNARSFIRNAAGI